MSWSGIVQKAEASEKLRAATWSAIVKKAEESEKLRAATAKRDRAESMKHMDEWIKYDEARRKADWRFYKAVMSGRIKRQPVEKKERKKEDEKRERRRRERRGKEGERGRWREEGGRGKGKKEGGREGRGRKGREEGGKEGGKEGKMREEEEGKEEKKEEDKKESSSSEAGIGRDSLARKAGETNTTFHATTKEELRAYSDGFIQWQDEISALQMRFVGLSNRQLMRFHQRLQMLNIPIDSF